MEPGLFITLPLSHYCEKSRWVLDYVGMPYKEIAQAPAFHRSATRRYGGTTVPLLAHNGNHINESAEIGVYADGLAGSHALYTQNGQSRSAIVSLEKKFDSELGTSVRRWAYSFLLDEPKLLRQMWSARVPFWQACLVPLILPKARRLVRQLYRVDERAAEDALIEINRVFDDVALLLADGRQYLAGDDFSAADIAFAALAAPILLPAECRAAMPRMDQLPETMRNTIATQRATPAGQFGLRLYRTMRDQQLHPR